MSCLAKMRSSETLVLACPRPGQCLSPEVQTGTRIEEQTDFGHVLHADRNARLILPSTADPLEIYQERARA